MPRKKTPKNVVKPDTVTVEPDTVAVELKVEPDTVTVEPDTVAVELKVEPDTVTVEPDTKNKKIECPTCGTAVLSRSMKKHLVSRKHLKGLQ
jgi:predicted RNA-binding Zn-ribbon protein involved in translation (DUF1610 family)